MTQLALFESPEKIEGQARVLAYTDYGWKCRVLGLISEMMTGEKFTCDNIRSSMDAEPYHPNAWGAIFSKAAKLKLIRKHGTYAPSRIPSCHGRMQAVWERI